MSLPPDAPGWPCRTEPRAELPDRLVSTLYVLLRDHLHPGDLEQLLCELAQGIPTWRDTAFSNPHLEALARAHASFLLDGVKTYPHQDGDVLVLGPEVFVGVGGDGAPVINYSGQNFVPQDGPVGVPLNDSSEKTAKCPTCGSPDPRRHPAVQFEGEVQPCGDTWHGPKVPMEAVMRPGGLPPSNAAREQAARAELAELELQRARERVEQAARRPQEGDRTPPMIVAAATTPDEALVAFIAQEMEHWGFGTELRGARNTVILHAEHRTFTVTVEEHEADTLDDALGQGRR